MYTLCDEGFGNPHHMTVVPDGSNRPFNELLEHLWFFLGEK